MTKREKREQRRKERLGASFKIGLGAQTVKCNCGNMVKIIPLNGWTVCPSCNATVERRWR